MRKSQYTGLNRYDPNLVTEASAKVRTGAPLDDEADYALPVWAGVLPLKLVAGEAIADSRVPSTINVPVEVQNYTR